jgi:hypothetical protein
VSILWTLLEENERTPAGDNMPQIPGFAILIADARAHGFTGWIRARSDCPPPARGAIR